MTDRETLNQIEEAWDDVKDERDIELSPKAIQWMINKLNEYISY